MVEGAGAYHVAKRLCDLEGRLPIDSVMSDSFQFWTMWRRQLCRLDSAAELTPQVGTAHQNLNNFLYIKVKMITIIVNNGKKSNTTALILLLAGS